MQRLRFLLLGALTLCLAGAAAAESPAVCKNHDPLACAAARIFLAETLVDGARLNAPTREELWPEMTSLDRWARYLAPEEYLALRAGRAAAAEGAGVMAFEEEGKLLIVPVEGGAAKAGGVEGPVYLDQPPAEAYASIEAGLRDGKPLALRQPTASDASEVVLAPAAFEPPFLEVTQVGGVQALRFFDIPTGTAAEQALRALRDLAGTGGRRLILDLRYSVGGDVYSALDIASLFIAPATPLGAIVTRDREIPFTASAVPKAPFTAEDAVVLVGPHTASAAESIAAILQSQGALVLGRATYGKCAIQSVLPLGRSGGALVLTTARYEPAADSYCDAGLIPNIEIEDPEAVNSDSLLLALLPKDILASVPPAKSPPVPQPVEQAPPAAVAPPEEVASVEEPPGPAASALETTPCPDGATGGPGECPAAPPQGEPGALGDPAGGAGLASEESPGSVGVAAPRPTPVVCLDQPLGDEMDRRYAQDRFEVGLDGSGPLLSWTYISEDALLCAEPQAGESVEDLLARMRSVADAPLSPYTISVRTLP